MNHLETDYLVIGAGTSGMAFVDTLLDHSDARVTIVDRHGKPGGHWNDAYPFVTLHQPSAYYGVNSTELGSGRKDTAGPNAGFYELASGAELCGYFDRVMAQRLLASGRVSYHPMCNVTGDDGFENLLSGERTLVTVRRKVVDAAYLGPSVPSTHVPRFRVGEGVQLIPPNGLPGLWQQAMRGRMPRRFVILGAGKTAMDAAVWLIGAGASADAIQWVVPRDAWLINRVTTQPGREFFAQSIGSQADQMEAFVNATSTDDLFLRLEACGRLLRIDPTRRPTMFHLATVSIGEVEVLRRIRDVVRLGRVKAIEADQLLLDQGRVPVAEGTVVVDCTASAVEPRPTLPIFQPRRIVLQMVRLPQPAFSAALTAWVEARVGDGLDDDAPRNALCRPVPFPHALDDYARSMGASMANQATWSQHKELRTWLRESRLDGFAKLMTSIAPDDAEGQAVLGRFRATAMAAMGALQRGGAPAG